MVKFDIDKKGYDIEQVENYINTLSLKYEEKLAEQKDRVFTMRNELDVLKNRLEAYQNKDKQISQALYFAVEKAEQIENSARKLYDLEIKRVNILYERWRVLIDQLEQSYGGKSIDPQISKMMDELKNGLDSVMAQNNNIANSNIKQELKENSDNYIKNLLNIHFRRGFVLILFKHKLIHGGYEAVAVYIETLGQIGAGGLEAHGI